MTNSEIMKLELTRHEVLDIRLVLLRLIQEMKAEYNDDRTTVDGKEILIRSIKKWSTLREKVISQFDLQDK